MYKKRLLRDSHQRATLTQTQNKTRQNYYANVHPLYIVQYGCRTQLFTYPCTAPGELQ